MLLLSFAITIVAGCASWGINGEGWIGALHEAAATMGERSGFKEDHVEMEDFRQGHTLRAGAGSADTNSADDWAHQGGPSASGTTLSLESASLLFAPRIDQYSQGVKRFESNGSAVISILQIALSLNFS